MKTPEIIIVRKINIYGVIYLVCSVWFHSVPNIIFLLFANIWQEKVSRFGLKFHVWTSKITPDVTSVLSDIVTEGKVHSLTEWLGEPERFCSSTGYALGLFYPPAIEMQDVTEFVCQFQSRWIEPHCQIVSHPSTQMLGSYMGQQMAL